MKGRRPLDSKILDARRAFSRHPERKRTTPDPADGVGQPPEYLSDGAKVVWGEVVGYVTPGWLKITDRTAFEQFSELEAKRRAGIISGIERQLLFKLIERFGFTPVDRNRIRIEGDSGKESLADKYLNS